MGGTFNPVHNAHLLVAEMAREQYALDKVIFITGGNPPHKNGMTDALHRFNMTRLAIADNAFFSDDNFEIKKSGKSYTVHTLEYLRERYPSDKLFFITGEDSLVDLPKWYNPAKILEMCTLLVFPRKSRESLMRTLKKIKSRYGGEIYPIDAPVIEISSTDIRKRIEEDKTVKYMLPDTVIKYIKENHLYEGMLNA